MTGLVIHGGLESVYPFLGVALVSHPPAKGLNRDIGLDGHHHQIHLPGLRRSEYLVDVIPHRSP
ncbi:hypothetical protein ES703_50637 [subsurface metagenome]